MRISRKLVLFALACSILPLMTAFWLSFHAARTSLHATFEETLSEQASEEMSIIQRRLASAKQDLSMLSRMSVMQNVRFKDWGGVLQTDLDRFVAASPDFVDVLVTDRHGLTVAATNPGAIGSDLGNSWEFAAPRLGIELDGVVSGSYRLDETIATQAMPIQVEDGANREPTFLGAVIGSISWTKFTDALRDRRLFGAAQGPGRQIVLQSTIDDSILYSTAGATIPEVLRDPIEGGKAFRDLQVDGRAMLAASVDSMAMAPFRDPQWRLHVLLDEHIAYASIHSLRDWFTVVGAGVLVLASLLAILLSRSITQPVRTLVHAAGQLAAGENDKPVPVSGRDEIGRLSRSFELMRRAVHENERELILKTEQSEAAARLKGEFLANMSHEVRTPINGVLGMTELLLATDLDATQGRYAETIYRSGQSLLSVINDILDFSKIEAGKLELQHVAFDLRELIEDIVDMVAESAHRKGLELALDMPPDCHVAYRGDSNRIRQVLLNLMSNAIKFTERGEVHLQVRPCALEDGRGVLSLKVSDTGIGISPSAVSSVFESFVQADGSTTRRFGGTGLGLAISSRLARLMGGSIDVDSVVGRGSCFDLRVPLEALPASVTDVWRDPDALRGRRVLVVDDNENNREILETQLRYWGAAPTMAVDGPACVETMIATSEGQFRFDLIVLDMHMPGMNGLELCQVLQRAEQLTDVPVVLLSSVCDQLDPDACTAAGIRSVITKPVRQPELYRCLTALLGGDAEVAPTRRRVLAARKLAGRVLLTEDNPTNQFMLTEMLGQIGLDVVVADHGWAAIERLEDGGYADGGFDVVLMDCQMPVLDGFAASREIRERERCSLGRRRMPIIALTANALAGDREACLEAGMDEYLCKPVSAGRLIEQLSVWIPDADASEDVTGTTGTTGTTGATGTTGTTGTAGAVSDASARDDAIEEPLAPVLDRAVYDDVLEMARGAPDGFLARLLASYRTSAAEDVIGIDRGLETGDAALVASRAHRLKSSSANWGASRLAGHCSAAETAARAGDLPTAAVAAAFISPALAELLDDIDPPSQRQAA